MKPLTDEQVAFLIRWGDYYADENSEEGRDLFRDSDGFEVRDVVRELAKEVKARRELPQTVTDRKGYYDWGKLPR